MLLEEHLKTSPSPRHFALLPASNPRALDLLAGSLPMKAVSCAWEPGFNLSLKKYIRAKEEMGRALLHYYLDVKAETGVR